MNNLFNDVQERLATKYRPKKLEDIKGHDKIIDSLKKMLDKNSLINLLFYGSSGIGKTTFANVIAHEFNYNLYTINATKVSKEELYNIFDKARNSINKSIVFIDEIHRLNKLQQDYLLEDAENSNFVIIGATTELPYGNINKALLSRMLVLKLNKLDDNSLYEILQRIIKNENIKIDEKILRYIIKVSRGDARVAINNLELIISLNYNFEEENKIREVLKISKDKNKENYISALIKSIRGSDIDASIYWLASLLSTDVDIEYIARRLVILSSEDVGLADPKALSIATSCMLAVEKIGMPEARIILAETVIYLAMSPKSNSAYEAINKALMDIEENGIQDVPYHLTHLGKKDYVYPHDYNNSYIKQKYMEKEKVFYNKKNTKIENGYSSYLEKIKNMEKK